jgi:hypothetical protein
MTADEARELSRKAVHQSLDISEWVKHFDGKIRSASVEGRYSTNFSTAGVRMPCSEEQRRLIREHYVSQGFTLTESVITWKRP